LDSEVKMTAGVGFGGGQRARHVAGGLRALAGAVLVLGVVTTAASPASAQVATCEALTLYGNAVSEGLCKILSPGTQNLWVCSLTDANPDVHTTFNTATDLHLTVRVSPAPPGCEGNSTLAGNWPGALQIAGGQPAALCNVGLDNYVARLNAVQQMPAGGQSLCRAPFLAAQAAGKISPALAQSYLNLCTAQACP
jgi:hypothetical protein